jgi:hypothetical protein
MLDKEIQLLARLAFVISLKILVKTHGMQIMERKESLFSKNRIRRMYEMMFPRLSIESRKYSLLQMLGIISYSSLNFNTNSVKSFSSRITNGSTE